MSMRVLNAIQRILLLLLLIPVVAICVDTLLRALDAQRGNAIVKAVRGVANTFILEPFQTVFAERQSYLQDAIVALVAYGVIALLIVFLFRGLRSLVSSKPPQSRPASKPAPKPASKPAPKADTAAAAPAKAESSPTAKTAATKDADQPPST